MLSPVQFSPDAIVKARNNLLMNINLLMSHLIWIYMRRVRNTQQAQMLFVP